MRARSEKKCSFNLKFVQWIRSIYLVSLLTCLGGCEDPSQAQGEGGEAIRPSNPCEMITCSDHGTCIYLESGPTCACDEGYQADPINGLGCILVGMSAGEMSAGEMSAGEMSAGEMSAGEMSAGEMSAGEMSAGEMSAGEMSAGEAMIDEGCMNAPEDVCVDALEDENALALCDGLDNDCDGQVDEGCGCKPGEVKLCFSGPPNRINVGACSPGTMRCLGDSGVGRWGPCEGERVPQGEICDGLDNDCNTCIDEIEACEPEISCPAPDDPRIPDAVPFMAQQLDGRLFYSGEASQWRWTITGGPCDDVSLGRRSFTLTGDRSEISVFTPTLSGSYQVTMSVTTPNGEVFECTWVLHVKGPGLRVEMCYPESTYLDLDLFLMRHSQSTSWFFDVFDPFSPSTVACSWANCEATIRGFGYSRVNWGYAPSPLSACIHTPQGAQWSGLVGECANPRLDIDNNLSEGIGVPENINIDQPSDGETYRVMVHNFSGTLAHPIINIYCGGERRATIGAAPDQVPNFQGASIFSVGAMWRAVDVMTHVDEEGVTTDCEITPLHYPGLNSGFDVTYDDTRF